MQSRKALQFADVHFQHLVGALAHEQAEVWAEFDRQRALAALSPDRSHKVAADASRCLVTCHDALLPAQGPHTQLIVRGARDQQRLVLAKRQRAHLPGGQGQRQV